MGVEGARGSGNSKVPSHTAYYVAIAGVLILVLLVCCYFLYFCLRRVKELSHQEFREVRSVRPPPPPISPTTYPVQPGVRDSASAMARICRSLPQDAVFPTSPASCRGRGVSAFSQSPSILLPTSPNRLPMSPTSPNRRTFAYYTAPSRLPLSPTGPVRRSHGNLTSPSRLLVSPTSPSRRGHMAPSQKAATVPARRVRSPHRPPAIVLSDASELSTTLQAPTVISMR